MERFVGLLGLLTILGIAYALSTNRKAIRLRTVAWGLGLQFALALFVLKTDVGKAVFQWLGGLVTMLLEFTRKVRASSSGRWSPTWLPTGRP